VIGIVGRSTEPDPSVRQKAVVRPELRSARLGMVEDQLAARGIRDPRVLDAMRTVPREAFVAPALVFRAYDDGPLPIGHDQTISQPYVVARMIEAVAPRPEDRALEIGTGSGYSAAVLARVVTEVFTVERLEGLAVAAARCLAELGYANVHVRCGDGTLGWPEHAPYDVIIVTAAGPSVPPTLRVQLAPGGRLVMPVGPAPHAQQLVRLVRRPGGAVVEERLDPVAFVPLIGAEGWPEPEPDARYQARTRPTSTWTNPDWG
jgi:protein-L-isoaspartate(D-aspartate) O-methyltransferase